MTTREKLIEILKLHNKRAVAEAAGLSGTTLANALSGKYQLRIQNLERLARVLRVDVGWLVDTSKGLPPVWAGASKPAHAA